MQGGSDAGDGFGGFGAEPDETDDALSFGVDEALDDGSAFPDVQPALAPVQSGAVDGTARDEMPGPFGVAPPPMPLMPAAGPAAVVAPNGQRPGQMVVRGAPPGYPHQMMPPGYQQHPMQVGVMPQEGSHMLGLSALAVGLGAIVGYRYGGIYGSFAGSLFGGAAVNAYRALYYYKEGTPEGDKEAAASATYAALTIAMGGYLAATKVKPTAAAAAALPNPPTEEQDDEPIVEPAGPCALRPVGPTILPPDEAWEQDDDD